MLILLSVLYLFAYLGMIITTIIVTKSDPTDPTVVFDRQLRSSSELNRTAIDLIQTHAEFYCNVCQAHVIENSKHCAYCNRCTHEFDHHCRWVSNDIGRSNYIEFLRMLIFVIITLVLQITLCVFAINLSEVDDSIMDFQELIVLNYVTIFTCAFFLLLVSWLLCFHCYLIRKNITTI